MGTINLHGVNVENTGDIDENTLLEKGDYALKLNYDKSQWLDSTLLECISVWMDKDEIIASKVANLKTEIQKKFEDYAIMKSFDISWRGTRTKSGLYVEVPEFILIKFEIVKNPTILAYIITGMIGVLVLAFAIAPNHMSYVLQKIGEGVGGAVGGALKDPVKALGDPALTMIMTIGLMALAGLWIFTK